MGLGETKGYGNGNENEEEKVISGELLWVKLKEATWWPAQVVDENFVSSANIPTAKGSHTDVLARLYGSYIYMYVDIHESRAEFKTILIAKNFNYHEIFKKSLQQDLPSSKLKKRQQSEFKGKKVTTDKSQVSSKRRKKEKAETDVSHPRTPQSKKSTSDTELITLNNVPLTPQQFSARRVKVMQSLGLVAPLGSPFPAAKSFCPIQRC